MLSARGAALRTRSLLALIALTVAAPVLHAQVPIAIPNSPAGTVLTQWLDGFNRADSAGLDAFYRTHYPRANGESSLRLARGSGGIELVRIISAEPSRIV